jgi:hypothetical protein
MTPIVHGVLGFEVHTEPIAQVMQAPAWQTRSTPQLVPLVALAASTQADTPLRHDTTPSLHGVEGLPVHEAPSEQAMQSPAELQTCRGPQLAPASRSAPLTHKGCAEQSSTPARQGSWLPVQADPAAQAVQLPAAQTWC